MYINMNIINNNLIHFKHKYLEFVWCFINYRYIIIYKKRNSTVQSNNKYYK